jgi:hypothetical protein
MRKTLREYVVNDWVLPMVLFLALLALGVGCIAAYIVPRTPKPTRKLVATAFGTIGLLLAVGVFIGDKLHVFEVIGVVDKIDHPSTTPSIAIPSCLITMSCTRSSQ